MSVIKSKLNTRSEEYKANTAAMSALVADLREKTVSVSGGGSPETAAKHKARGKLLPRERINALIDPGAPFLEFSAVCSVATSRAPRVIGSWCPRCRRAMTSSPPWTGSLRWSPTGRSPARSPRGCAGSSDAARL